MQNAKSKKVFYIGFYDGSICSEKRKTTTNVAATLYIDFIIDSLKEAGFHVTLISLAIGDDTGFFPKETISVDDFEEQVYLEYFSIRYKSHHIGAIQTIKRSLLKYIDENITANDTLISYHSLVYGDLLEKKRDEIGFTWIAEVNEIYCLSRGDLKDTKYLEQEVRKFSHADKYIFANNQMANTYSDCKPYVIAYGNYKVFLEKEVYCGDNVGIVYTGIINADRGVFKAIDAMRYLPNNYTFHILGFGTDDNIFRLQEMAKQVNEEKGFECIKYYGKMVGREYTDFLSRFQIGVSLMDTNEDIAYNAFPSKILAYLGHSLFVVSSRAMCVEKSSVAELIYFCGNEPKEIANAIMSVNVYGNNPAPEKLRQLRKAFIEELGRLIGK